MNKIEILTCHCKKVEIELNLENGVEELVRCNCSLCKRRGYIMAKIKLENLNSDGQFEFCTTPGSLTDNGCILPAQQFLIVYRYNKDDFINLSKSDYFSISIDSYHDHQTGYEFIVNAAGVQFDSFLFDDIDFSKISVNMTINVPAVIIFAYYVALAIKRN